MAERKLSSAMKKIKIPKRLLPEKFLKQTDVALVRGHISFSAQEWIGMFVFIGLILALPVGLLISPLYGIAVFIVALVLMMMVPRMKADSRRAQVEDALPDALHHMSVAIRTGLVLESVLQEISEADYGALSEEYAQVVLEIKRGRPLRDAFLNFAARSGSKEIKRAVYLLLEGIESGGPISDVLEEVSEDMRAVKEVKRERKTSTSQQISFLAMASLMAGPFVMGVVASLPQIMETAMAGSGTMSMDEFYAVVDALTFYVMAQAAGCGIMMGVIMFGEFKSGFKYMLPMAIAAYFIYSVVRYVMPGMVSTF